MFFPGPLLWKTTFGIDHDKTGGSEVLEVGETAADNDCNSLVVLLSAM